MTDTSPSKQEPIDRCPRGRRSRFHVVDVACVRMGSNEINFTRAARHCLAGVKPLIPPVERAVGEAATGAVVGAGRSDPEVVLLCCLQTQRFPQQPILGNASAGIPGPSE